MANRKKIESGNRFFTNQIIGIILFGILAFIFITLGPLLFGGKDSSPIVNDLVRTEIVEEKVDENSRELFDELLLTEDIGPLKRKFAQLQEATGLPVVLRIENLSRQLALPDRLLRLDIDDKTHDGIVEGKLLALLRRESLAIKHSMYSYTSANEAADYASTRSVAEHPKHADLAAALGVLTSVSDFLFELNPELRVRKRFTALKSFYTAANRDPNSEILAEKLYELIGQIQDEGAFTDADPFVSTYVSAFAGSERINTVAFVDELRLVAMQTRSILPSLLNISKAQRQTNVERFTAYIQAEFTRRDIHPAVVTKAIENLEHLIRIGYIDEATFLKSQIAEHVKKDKGAQLKMAELDRIIEISSSRFTPSGLLNGSGRPVDDLDLKRRSILIFFSQAQTEQTIQIITDTGKSLRNRYRDENLRFAIVFVREKAGDRPPEQIMALAKRADIPVWLLNVPADSGQAFLANFPIDKTPLSLLLRDGSRIVALDTPGEIAGQIVFQD